MSYWTLQRRAFFLLESRLNFISKPLDGIGLSGHEGRKLKGGQDEGRTRKSTSQMQSAADKGVLVLQVREEDAFRSFRVRK